MASVNVISALQVKAWKRKMVKQIIKESFWDTFSNRTTSTVVIPNGGEAKAPKDAIHYVSDQFKRGVQFTTIPSLDKLKKKGQGGSQAVLGNEEKPVLRYSRVYYNVQRKGVVFADGSVEGDMTEAYDIANQRVDLLTDYFKELNDYNKTRALIAGADEFLTESEYWTGDSITSPPVSKSLHPNLFYSGQGTTAIAHVGTWATDVAALRTALNTLYTTTAVNAGTYKFTKARLDKVLSRASQFVSQLNWKMGDGQTVRWIVVLSRTQADELRSDTASGGWYDLFKEAGSRGVKNRTITGILGYYQGALLVVNERQPLFNCTVSGFSADSAFQYVKPWNDDGSSSSIYTGDNRIPTVKSGTNDSDGAGTCEVAMVLGLGAIGCAEVRKLSFNNEDSDYMFNKMYEARKSDGAQRLDFSQAALSSFDSSSVVNWSSMLFFSPTPAQAWG